MISIDSEQDSNSSIQSCAACGGLHGKQGDRRIIICYSGDLVRVPMAVGQLRRYCLAYGLKLSVSETTRLHENTQSIVCSCMISAPADFIWLSTNPDNPLQRMMLRKVAKLGVVYDVLNFNYSQSYRGNCLTIRRNTFDEFCGTFDGGGNMYAPEKNLRKVWGLWHAVLVPFPHFCQWKKVPASCRMWSNMWSPPTATLPLALIFEGLGGLQETPDRPVLEKYLRI